MRRFTAALLLLALTFARQLRQHASQAA